ncbi:Tetratricopeptide repeat family [Favolaschia claudopus]|uniref:Tetratricopeptide repeat family n=1 Tax=Favolaschia claudopus TaxID=2862362 RepID=A0AAW0AA54_9AGAR
MDPISVTATIITLGTFIRDLIELGEGIRSSIEQAWHENQRQIRDLTQDIVRTLYELANLTRGKEGVFHGPELLGALQGLKAEMLKVHSKCLKISPIPLPGFRGIRFHLKAWRKRDELEKQIGRLRERVQNCISQFTAFSAARTEHLAAETAHRTLRIEKRLIVDNIENQVKARRLEGLMARVMLDSEFGHCKLRETAENISADSSFQTLEYQYVSAQLSSLINSIKPMLASEDLSLYRGWKSDTLTLGWYQPSIATPLHALSHILGIILAIHSRDHASLLDLLMEAMDNLSMCFSFAGMPSEEIVWDHFKIDLLRYMANRGYDIGTLPRMAHTLSDISGAHRRRSELDVAIELSQQSLALWVEISHLLPEADNRIGYLVSMLAHVTNLLVANDDKTTMLSAAQDAVSLARPMAKALAESMVSRGTSLTTEEESNAAIFCEAFFIFANVLSSLNRPVDSYKAFVEAFRTASSLPILNYDRDWRHDIDSFLNVICIVAKNLRLSLSMLADCVNLFRNLTHIYPEQYSSGFLRVLHAFAYFSQQPHSSHPVEQIRLFLRPAHDAAPPAIDINTSIPIDSSVLADAMHLCFAEVLAREKCTLRLFQNILVAHFPQAIEALRGVVQSPVFDVLAVQWVHDIIDAVDVIVYLLPAEYAALLQVLLKKCRFLGSVKNLHAVRLCGTLDFKEEDMHSGGYYFRCLYEHAARFEVDKGISFCQEISTYLQSQYDAHAPAVMWSHVFLGLRAGFLCDAALFPDAVFLVKSMGSSFPEPGDLGPGSGDLTLWAIKAQILQREGRYMEAFQLLRMGVADGIRKFWIEKRTFDCYLYFLLPQLAWAWREIGKPAKALEYAENALMACEDIDSDPGLGDAEEHKIICVQIHSLTVHSDCLAAVGKTDEGLESAQEAVSLYTEYYCMWKHSVIPIRDQELGGNAFFALSLRLLAVDDREEALLNVRRATGLYRELVALAPRHLPTLARSLRLLASILWLLGYRNEAVAASKEAVDILRKVADSETYFLPTFAAALDQLAIFLFEMRDLAGGLSATMFEHGKAIQKYRSLPPRPKWLFNPLEEEDSEDANWWEWEPENHHGALQDPVIIPIEADEVESDTGYEDALETIVFVEDEDQTIETQESRASVSSEDSDDIDNLSDIKELDDLTIGEIGTIVAQEAADGLENEGMLSKQVETRLRLSMPPRSTLMDFIWWILLLLLAILFALMYARVV